MQIRDAYPEDAQQICDVVRRSIAELCAADHGNDPAILGHWLVNKTPEIVTSWIQNGNNSTLIAVEDTAVLAAGAVTNSGEITLNYVSPAARVQGVSRALLHALEQRAVERGNRQCRLTSTATARRFYLARGYEELEPISGLFGTPRSYPMIKRFQAPQAREPMTKAEY